MKNKRYIFVYTLLAVCGNLPAMTTQKSYDQKKLATDVIKDALLGYRVRKKTVQQLEISRTTEWDVSVNETFDGVVEYECYLYHKNSTEKCGSLTCRLVEEGPVVKLDFIHACESRLGVGTYLFNTFLRMIYALNKGRVDQKKKPYTKIIGTANPINGEQSDPKKALDDLIKFYETFGVKVSLRKEFTAEVYFDL